MTMIEKEWAERVRAAVATRTPLCLRGGGSKDFFGCTLAGERFDLRAFHDAVLSLGSVPLPLLEQHIDAWIAQRRSAG